MKFNIVLRIVYTLCVRLLVTVAFRQWASIHCLTVYHQTPPVFSPATPLPIHVSDMYLTDISMTASLIKPFVYMHVWNWKRKRLFSFSKRYSKRHYYIRHNAFTSTGPTRGYDPLSLSSYSRGSSNPAMPGSHYSSHSNHTSSAAPGSTGERYSK